MKPEDQPAPFVWCFAVSLLAVCCWLMQDFVARADSLLLPFALFNFLVGISTVWVFGVLLALGISVILWLAEKAVTRLSKKLKPGSSSLFVLYSSVVYSFALYFRYYCGTFEVLDIAKFRWLFVGAFALGLALYPIRFREEARWARTGGRRFAPGLARLTGLLTAGALAILLVAAVHRPEKSQLTPDSKPHIVIVTCDALRSQNMSLYGYSRNTTPNLVSLAETCYVFERFRAVSTGTEQAMPALRGDHPVLEDDPSFLGDLKRAGYEESVFISFTALNSTFRRGFSDFVLMRSQVNHPLLAFWRKHFRTPSVAWITQIVSEPSYFFNIASPYNPTYVALVDRTRPKDSFQIALDYLAQAHSPRLVWVHLYQPHFPYYLGNQPLFGNEMRDRYDADIFYVDRALGQFIEALEGRGIWDSTLFVLASDHGEALGETVRGLPLYTHGANWSNEMLADIPLLVRLPGQTEAVRVATHSSQLDLTPTLLDIIKQEPGKDYQGESLLRYMENPQEMSPGVRVCIPKSFFYRQEHAVDPENLPDNWPTAEFDEFLGYTGRFEIRWFQLYDVDASRIVSKPNGIHYAAVYDMISDPERKSNLYNPDNPKIQSLIAQLEQDPVVQATR